MWGSILKTLRIHQSQIVAVSLVILLVFVILANTSAQTLYWFAALIPYAVPILPVTMIAGGLIWLFTNKPAFILEWLAVGLMILCVVAATGFTEIYATLQVASFTLLWFWGWFYIPRASKPSSLGGLRKKWLLVMGILWIVALISLLVVALAPGNFVRLSQQDTSNINLNLIQLGINIFVFTLLMFFAEGNAFAFFLFTFFTVILGLFWWYSGKYQQNMVMLWYPKRPLLVALLAGIVGFLLVAAVIAPPVYATGHLPARIIFPARFIQICLFVFWGYLAAVALAKYRFRERYSRKLSYRLARGALISLMLIIPFPVLLRHVDLLQNVPRYAAEWDNRHALIVAAREAGETKIIVEPLAYNIEDYLQLEKIEPESKANWVNGCASNYYGIEVFVTKTQ
jgi:hypothetical protein